MGFNTLTTIERVADRICQVLLLHTDTTIAFAFMIILTLTWAEAPLMHTLASVSLLAGIHLLLLLCARLIAAGARRRLISVRERQIRRNR